MRASVLLGGGRMGKCHHGSNFGHQRSPTGPRSSAIVTTFALRDRPLLVFPFFLRIPVRGRSSKAFSSLHGWDTDVTRSACLCTRNRMRSFNENLQWYQICFPVTGKRRLLLRGLVLGATRRRSRYPRIVQLTIASSSLRKRIKPRGFGNSSWM